MALMSSFDVYSVNSQALSIAVKAFTISIDAPYQFVAMTNGFALVAITSK